MDYEQRTYNWHLQEVVGDRDLVREESEHFSDRYDRSEMSARFLMTDVQTCSHQFKPKAAGDDGDCPTSSFRANSSLPTSRSIVGKLKDLLRTDSERRDSLLSRTQYEDGKTAIGALDSQTLPRNFILEVMRQGATLCITQGKTFARE